MLSSHSSTSRVHGHLQIMLYKQVFFMPLPTPPPPAEHLVYVELLMCLVFLRVKSRKRSLAEVLNSLLGGCYDTYCHSVLALKFIFGSVIAT